MAVRGLFLALFYTPQKNWKEWENFIDINTSEEAKNRNKAFWMLHDAALVSDDYIKKCKEVFGF